MNPFIIYDKNKRKKRENNKFQQEYVYIEEYVPDQKQSQPKEDEERGVVIIDIF